MSLTPMALIEMQRIARARQRGQEGTPMGALDCLVRAVESLAAERDELRDRVARAVAELDAAPDADPDKPSKRAMREVLQANTRAWAVLCEGRDPPSRRRAEDAPRDAGEGEK